MAYLHTKITTFPALPIADITTLEKLVLSKVLHCAETDEGCELYTDAGPVNPIVVPRGELIGAISTSDQATESLLNNFVKDRVLSILPADDFDTETMVFIDLNEFPWQFIVQDILTRSATVRELVVIQWINDSSQQPDTFGASVSLITKNGIFHATSEDLLVDFRKRDQALASEASSAQDSDPSSHIEADDIRVDSPNDTVDALIAAERFIVGFEDDEAQEGIADILAGLRGAIRRERLRPVLLDTLKELRAAAIGFRNYVYKREPHLRVGGETVNVLSAFLLNAERIIALMEGRTDG